MTRPRYGLRAHSSEFSRVPYGELYLYVSLIRCTPSISLMYAATEGGTRLAQSPSLYIRLRTSVPLSSSRSTIGRETAWIPRSFNTRITRGELVYTAPNFGTSDNPWPTHTPS